MARRNYAIDRMVAEGKITVAQGEEAKKTEIKLAPKQRPDELAPYFVEEIRQYLEKTYGRSKYLEGGLKVYSTLNVADAEVCQCRSASRDSANTTSGTAGAALNETCRGRTSRISRPTNCRTGSFRSVPTTSFPELCSRRPRAPPRRIGTYRALLTPRDIAWTGAKASPEKLLKPGDVALFQVRTINPADGKIEVMLEQNPKVQGALVAIEPQTGEIKALVGGYDFDDSKFDRATQAMRQTGFVIQALCLYGGCGSGRDGLEDTIVELPISFGNYSPGNYDGKYEGRITIRHALADSRNIPAVKILAMLGVENLIPYVRRFGITSKMDPLSSDRAGRRRCHVVGNDFGILHISE